MNIEEFFAFADRVRSMDDWGQCSFSKMTEFKEHGDIIEISKNGIVFATLQADDKSIILPNGNRVSPTHGSLDEVNAAMVLQLIAEEPAPVRRLDELIA